MFLAASAPTQLGGVPRLPLWLEIVPRNSPSPQFTSIRGTKGLSKSEKKFSATLPLRWSKVGLFSFFCLVVSVVSVIRSTPLFIRSYPPNTFLLSGHGSTVTELSIQNNISLLMPARPYQEMLTEINISPVKTRQHASTRRSAVCETRHNSLF
jgi:hypothetical protein